MHPKVPSQYSLRKFYLTLREEESNQALFAFLFNAFQLLDTREEGMANFHIWFMLHFTRFLGILPGKPEIAGAYPIVPDEQVFLNLPEEAVAAQACLMANSQGPVADLRLSNNSRILLLERIIRYYSLHVEGFSRLRSFTVLREVFG
jgi:DNA repair protein RecO (recombination protein O)